MRSRPYRLGLQRRIMLYVTVGLSAMFGVAAFLGLGAIDQATDLVFNERLAAAHTTASILERDFEAIASETREEVEELGSWSVAERGSTEGTAGLLFAHFSEREVSPFFKVSGVWVLDIAGRLLDTAGSPRAAEPGLVGGDGAVLSVPSSGSSVLGATVILDVVSNDTDTDGAPIYSTVRIVTQPANGVAVNFGNGARDALLQS